MSQGAYKTASWDNLKMKGENKNERFNIKYI